MVYQKIFRSILKTNWQILIFCLLGSPTFAQISLSGTPISFEHSLNKNIPTIDFAQVDVQALLIEDSIDQLRNQPMRFGKAHETNISSEKDGSWSFVKNEYKIWRLAIVCKDAFSVNLIYKNFKIPEGGKLFLYNEDQSFLLGAFTSENNKDRNPEFATGLVPGEKIILEYNAPINTPKPQIEISTVVHGYKNFFNFGDSEPCNNNVNCPEGFNWMNQTNSVAMIVLGNGSRWCSGAMINNTCEDGTPYFLTANHCLTGQGVGNWMFYFNYQSPTCSNIDGPTNQIVSGATLIANSGASDFALLELDSRPPLTYNAYYSGWSNTNTAADSTVSIHHPSGDIKKISFSNQSTQSTNYLANTIDTNESHWRVPTWDDGTTEGGSSGSPLFNTDKQIIGQLHGGYASCSNITSDWYGKLSYSWDQGITNNSILSVWLDPAQSNADTLNGKYFSVVPTLDAAISQIASPLANSCYRIQIPEISFINKGSDTITSLNIAWEIIGLVSDTINWTGQLLPQQLININLDTIAFNFGTYNLVSEIIAVNGQNDNNSCNNLKSKSFVISQGNEVTLNMRSDNWPEELRFEIADTSGNIISSLSNFTANALESFTFCLTPSCYDLTVFDSYGDGILNPGYFNFEYNDSVYFDTTGAFGNCTGSSSGTCFVTYRLCMDSGLLMQLPTADFRPSDTLFNIGDTVRIEDLSSNFPDSWEWTLISDSANYNFSTNHVEFIAQTEGRYDVKLKVSNIFGTDSLLKTNSFRIENTLGFSNKILSEIKIYPNPAEEVLNIRSSFNGEKVVIELVSLEGKLIRKVISEKSELSIDISDISNGLYLIKLNSKSISDTRKIMIQ